MLAAPNSVETPTPDPTDEALIASILAGKTHQFDLLVTRHRNRVFRFILKFIDNPVHAEDLAQDTFISAFQNLDTFQGNAKFSTWLLGIARNKVMNDINRAGKRRSQMISDEILQKYPSAEDTPLEAAQKQEQFGILKESLEQLDADLKGLLVAVSMEGLSYEEVAQMQQIPVGTVKSKLYRARRLLKEKIKKKKYEHF